MNAQLTSSLRFARRAGRMGFTMTEMLIAISLGTIVMAGILTTYVMAVKGFQAMANYWEIHADGRFAVDRFVGDMRAVSDITSFSQTDLTCVIPTSFSGNGTVLSTKTVRYFLNGGSLYRYDSTTGTTKKLADNIYQLRFYLYDKLGVPTSSPAVAKAIQVEIKLRKFTVSQVQSEDYLSARVDMRNKP